MEKYLIRAWQKTYVEISLPGAAMCTVFEKTLVFCKLLLVYFLNKTF